MSENRTGETRKRKAPKTAFKPGVSGNPGGRPKAVKEVQELARKYSRRSIRALARIVQESPDDRARIAAAEALLNRAWGKPTQSVEMAGADGGPLLVQVVTYANEADE